MTFTPYQKATAAAKEAVIEALKIDEDASVLSELWRHYLGLRTIEQNNLHHNETTPVPDVTQIGDISMTTTGDKIEFDYDPSSFEMNYAAAGPVDIGFPGGGSVGTDVITFS